MKILVVAAHPDDEVIGLGGTLLKHKAAGDDIFIQILTDGYSSRDNNKDKTPRDEMSKKAAKILKADLYLEKFQDQKLETYSFIDVVKTVEKIGKKVKPDVVYTHCESDLNLDHQIAFRAVFTAFRFTSNFAPKKILCFETFSSTEYGFSSFEPNYFNDISAFLSAKMKLLKIYDSEIKNHPHPRSYKNIFGSAQRWGGICKVEAAEAFYLVREFNQ